MQVPTEMIWVRVRPMWSLLVMVLFVSPMALAGEAKPTETSARGPESKETLYPDPYGAEIPDFAQKVQAGGRKGPFRGWIPEPKKMKLSTEKSFFSFNLVEESDRANALVAAGMEKEIAGQWRDALKIYQQLYERLLNKNPDILYRISKHGIFVPVAQYVQRRILRFPKEHLAYYRTLCDARAKEAYEQARRQYSLIGLSNIVDTMLATSYGDNALMDLGNAALDSGHYLEALEHFTSVRDFFPDSELLTSDLDLRIQYCNKMLGEKAADESKSKTKRQKSSLSKEALANLRRVTARASYQKPAFHSQMASHPNVASDDYTLFPSTEDPLALRTPEWSFKLPGSRRDQFVYSQPVVTSNSIIYRHKNIIYSHSILNGEQRWVFDLGGRAVWQSKRGRAFPQEDCIVQDGLVFSVLHKGGPSLVAVDEVTGQLKWAYGPMTASTPEEANMRFEAAPAGGPRTIFAGFVQDNIEGETHTDSLYGIIAFDSATGRIRWKKILCRLPPGKFTSGNAGRIRNRIRSFVSPPLYNQGTVYYNTNAGAVVALDARSGRIKWLMKYPYYPGIHDATHAFGAYPYSIYRRAYYPSPSLWYNQRPLIVKERLFVTPVDSKFFFCIDRRTGKVHWSRFLGADHMGHTAAGPQYLMGPTREGHLVLAQSRRTAPVQLIDPQDGKTVWTCPDVWTKEKQPSVAFFNSRFPLLGGRPFLTENDELHLPVFINFAERHWDLYASHLSVVSLKERKVKAERNYYSDVSRWYARECISVRAPAGIKELESLPRLSAKQKEDLKGLKVLAADTMPQNQYGPYAPQGRVTFRKYGTTFEVRFGARELSVLYDKAKVMQALASRKDPEATFARAELALSESRLAEAGELLKRCLKTINTEDLDFRAMINQQLFRVHKRLARGCIRAGQTDQELENALGMSRTASTLAQEIETYFALAEAHRRKGDFGSAARSLRRVIGTYAHHEVPVSSVAVIRPEGVRKGYESTLERLKQRVGQTIQKGEFNHTLSLMRNRISEYLSTVSPLSKDLNMRAGELAVRELRRLQTESTDFQKASEEAAKVILGKQADHERLHLLAQFPGTKAAQQVLNSLFENAGKLEAAGRRRRIRPLADVARGCGLDIPEAFRKQVFAPPALNDEAPLKEGVGGNRVALDASEAAARLVLERRGDRARHPHLLFLGARVKKRLDNKFTLSCVDLTAGKMLWETKNIRLRGTGQEPGFFEAFVIRDTVVVHGLYNVLAFDIKSGKSKWHFRAPFDFEIRHVAMSGELLVLAGAVETIALDALSEVPAGEVAWQVKEEGDLYNAPYFQSDRFVSIRKMPFNVTVRSRTTGRLIGRLDLPDLTLYAGHPLLDAGPEALPAAHYGNVMIVSDGWYYIAIDTQALTVLWKRLIDRNDVTREPAMRFALNDKYFYVLKEDYDQKVCYMLSARTGEILWRTDPVNAKSPRPMHAVVMDGERVYGLGVHPAQGFYLTGRDCRTGTLLFNTQVKGFKQKPVVNMLPRVFGKHLTVLVEDRQDMHLRVFEIDKGKPVHALQAKGVGPFGLHGRVSATMQDGHAVLMNKDELKF